VTALPVEDQERFHPELCNAVSRRFAWEREQQTTLIERLTGDEDESEESLQVPLRLLIDEIVEDLSRNSPAGAGARKSDRRMHSRTRFIPLGERQVAVKAFWGSMPTCPFPFLSVSAVSSYARYP